MAAARVLLVHGIEPSGHAAAASALEEAFRALGAPVERVRVAGEHHPAAGRVVAGVYHGLLRVSPRVVGRLYRSEASQRLLKAVRGAYLSLGGAGRMRREVDRRGAAVVVCPQASVAAVLSEARRRGDLEVPVAGVLTDYHANPFWADPPPDLLYAPTEEVASELAALGVPRARLRPLGVPVHPAFAAAPPRARARRALDLPPDAPVVLLSGGNQGMGDLEAAADALLRAVPGGYVLGLCGRNERLLRTLASRPEAGERLRLFGPQPPAVMAMMRSAADLHVGKPGGLSVAECLASGLPMLLLRPLPGQEESNAAYLRRLGAALAGGGSRRAARLCAELLADRPRLAGMRKAAARAGKPGAAAAIAADVAAFLRARRGGRP